MALHILEPERATLHGQFSPDLPPALVVDSGDVVRYRTLDVTWGMEQHGAPGAPRQKFEPRESPRDDGPCMVGPVAVRGAEPGMVLEARILRVEPAGWGWTFASRQLLAKTLLRELPDLAAMEPVLLRWSIDGAALTATSEWGQTVPIRPFLGTLGLAPGEPGWHSGWPPRATGGNLDCRELVAGSTLYLPIAALGALVSLGDGHAAQGDGELAGSAIECPMEHVEIQYLVRDDLPLKAPQAYTPAGWLALGVGDTLEQAAAMAVDGVLEVLAARFGLSRPQALALASVAVDLRVTQVVNGVVGAHALLPHRGVRSEE